MFKKLGYFLLLALIFMVGCSDSLPYGDDEVAATVRGDEITIGDLRFLYPDNTVTDRIEGTVKLKLVMQEAKNMGIDVSEDVEEIMKDYYHYPPEANTDAEKKQLEFFQSQAKKLGMEPEEYYKQYAKINSEISLYIKAYLNKKIGEPTDDVDVDAYNKKANQLMDDLMKKYEDDIEILIK